MHEPLCAIVSSRAKVAVLRVLQGTDGELHIRELVRRTEMAYGSVALAVDDLLACGVLEQAPGGRERRVRLRSGHRLVAAIGALFRAEADYYPALRVELRAAFTAAAADGLLGAAIVGAVARRAERLGDELELVVIVRDAAAIGRNQATIDRVTELMLSRFGVRVRASLFVLEQARAMWRTRTPAAERNVREAEPVAGTPLLTLLSVDG